MALDGRAVADFAEGAASGDLDGGLRGPRRLVLRFWATQAETGGGLGAGGGRGREGRTSLSSFAAHGA